MLDFIVCDDNEYIRKSVSDVINSYMMKNDQAYKIRTFSDYNEEFMELLSSNGNYRIYILDIEAPTKSGIDVARIIRKKDKESAIIFLTAHEECGYSVLKSCTNFLTFISKFDDYEKNLSQAIKEALNLLHIKKVLSFTEHSVTYNITVSNILYVTKDTLSRKSIIITDNNIHKTYMTITELLDKLSPVFMQTHRSCIVNKDRVEKIDKNKNLIIFDNGVEIDLLSDKYKKELVSCG
ncbi:MAG: LytTR family DNA-binding domain-containing protein [Clostridium sp.]|nr:LytTR family DNA-binding domain-containing protein [Clostridium sp.]MCM1443920.1 LytTR family DNA-binding domain-containing protein [Candidatus Amulumruptor caecigallinarius]